MTNVNRGRRSTGGELLVPAPTFTESLLMEILIRSMVGMEHWKKVEILTRAGFTEAEIQERLQ